MREAPGFAPAYMIDQSHNVTDPIESLMQSAIEIARAYVQASLVDREALAAAQGASDVMGGHRLVKQAFITDVSPILAEARRRKGGAIDPIGVYRAPAIAGTRRRSARHRAWPPRGLFKHSWRRACPIASSHSPRRSP